MPKLKPKEEIHPPHLFPVTSKSVVVGIVKGILLTYEIIA